MRKIRIDGEICLIEVRLFGELRHHAASGQPSGTAIYLPAGAGKTVGQILANFGIEPEAVGNVFLNGRLMPRSVYPLTLGYPSTSQVPIGADAIWNTIVRSGDRLGLFPRTMSAVVV